MPLLLVILKLSIEIESYFNKVEKFFKVLRKDILKNIPVEIFWLFLLKNKT